MTTITQTTALLSLNRIPSEDSDRSNSSIKDRIIHLKAISAKILALTLCWPTMRSNGEFFEHFESQLQLLLHQVGRAAMELMLGVAEDANRGKIGKKFTIKKTTFRLSTPQARSFNTLFGVIRYCRSYARPIGGGVGHFPLDFDLGLLKDRISPTLLSIGARLATRMSFAQAQEVLGWFVPQPPSTEVLEQTILGLGHQTLKWFKQAPAPENDGEVLVIMIDGKCVPTARSSELEKRRGKRVQGVRAASPRHRGRDLRKQNGRAPRRKKGDKSKNGKQAMMVVTYTLTREGDLLLGPKNRRVYASFGKKRHAFEYALEEAERRGFGKGTDKTVQILTDGDPNLHLYTDQYFNPTDYPNRVVTVDVVHVLEKLWDAGRARYSEGSKALTAWVRAQENRLYGDRADLVIKELEEWLLTTPMTGPGNKGRRKRLTDAIRYLARRLDKLNYGTYRKRDLEVGTGQVEGAIKHVIGKRCDQGGMRWIASRAQAIIQLRCIEVNGHWKDFTKWALTCLRTLAESKGVPVRLQEKEPAKLPQLNYAI